MLATLMPLFDKNMKTCAYSIFAQKENLLITPSAAGSARFDGAGTVPELEVVSNMGDATLSGGKEVVKKLDATSIFTVVIIGK